MQERKRNNKRSKRHHTDAADRFREESLKAIRNRKRFEKLTFRILVATAFLMLCLAIAAYFVL